MRRDAIVLVVATVLVATPVRTLFLGPGSPWWAAYVVWIGVLLLGGWARLAR